MINVNQVISQPRNEIQFSQSSLGNINYFSTSLPDGVKHPPLFLYCSLVSEYGDSRSRSTRILRVFLKDYLRERAREQWHSRLLRKTMGRQQNFVNDTLVNTILGCKRQVNNSNVSASCSGSQLSSPFNGGEQPTCRW